MRFQLWQLDAFEFPLFTAPGCQAGQRVCVYQLIDDATRFDVGTRCFPRPENQHDAMIVVKQAIADYGAPQELLSDNSTAFHQLRRGLVGPLEVFLASQGCMPISSTPGHPTTQGKVERSHQTLQQFLKVREPTTVADVEHYLALYRELYNYRRAHQALSGTTPVTPGQAWELIEHVPATEPIDLAILEYRASQYAQRHPKRPTKQPPPLPERPPEPDNQPGQPPMELVFVTHKSRYAYYRSYHIGLPNSHANRYYYRQITPTEYLLWDPDTGELVMSFPLPLVALPPTNQFIPSYAIKGVKLHNAPDLWTRRKLSNQLSIMIDAIQLD